MKMMGFGGVAALALLATAVQAQVPELPKEKAYEFVECFQATRAGLEAKRVTPERYQMVIEGACLAEEQASLEEFEGYLRRTDGGHRDVTARTMSDTRGDYRRMRAQVVSEYALAYETNAK